MQITYNYRQPLQLYYDSSPLSLCNSINNSYMHPYGPKQLPDILDGLKQLPTGILVPHGAYCDSGPIQAQGFFHLAQYRSNLKTVLILGNNHTWPGDCALSDETWLVPNGKLEPDKEGIELFNKKIEIPIDNKAHAKEHSIENQLPFLRHIKENIKIIPITIGLGINQKAILSLANKISALLKQNLNLLNIAIIATSDFSHEGPGYNSALLNKQLFKNYTQFARTQDLPILDAILTKDVDQLIKTQQQIKNSLCGFNTICLMMHLMNNLGLNKIELLKYAVGNEILNRSQDATGFGSFSYQK